MNTTFTMNPKLVAGLHFIVNISANLFMMDVIPPHYKAIAILIFNVIQVVYAYMDPSYAIQKLGKKTLDK